MEADDLNRTFPVVPCLRCGKPITNSVTDATPALCRDRCAPGLIGGGCTEDAPDN